MTATGICRCCLNISLFKDITIKHEWMGTSEMYTDMLWECFKIPLKPVNDMKNLATICEFCIIRLRDAYNFWKQVLESEEGILLKLKEFKDEADKIKDEDYTELEVLDEAVVKKELSRNNNFVDVNYGTDDGLMEEIVPQNKRRGSKSNNKTKGEINKPSKRLNNSLKSLKIIKATNEEFLQNIKFKRTRENKLQEHKGRANALVILENTTCNPFRWSSQKGFVCFYCSKAQPNIECLRDHTTTHKQEKLKSLVHKQDRQRFIKIDITHLNCKLCSKNFNKLTEIKTHLMSVHSKKFLKTPHDYILPYRLSNSDLNCAICDDTFTSFHTLNMHMNTHYGNYVCETCGSTFINEERLNIHQGTHENGVYPCTLCSRKFNSPVKLANHKAVAHCNRNHRCHACGEVFRSFHLKQTHRIKVHNEKHLLHVCEVCNKSYPRRSHLNYHIRRSHLREKNYVCEVCTDGFFSKKELSDHTLKHSGEKSHECEVCHKKFGRKHSLVEHMRIHNNDRRFMCGHCGQSFIQKCSLKGHLKTHHSIILE